MNHAPRVLDLFSGIGGFSLGLERAGMRTVAFCEIDPYCRAVLRKHWPDVPIFEDIRTLRGTDATDVDIICGGFPCQDISVAGKGAGIDGSRSGLWSEYARLIDEIRPQFAIVENVTALLGRGLGRVLGDLAEIGYDAEWHCIPASAVGAAHRRDRIWIVAYPYGKSVRDNGCASVAGEARAAEEREEEREWLRADSATGGGRAELAYSNIAGLEGRLKRELQERASKRIAGPGSPSWQRYSWEPEPDVGRVANGIPSLVDRLRALGNAVVPQIPEIIGRAIMKLWNRK